MIRRSATLAFLAAATWLPSAFAESPTPLAEVVVTASLRTMAAKDLPASVSVIAGDDVRNGAVAHLEELLPQIPSLSWAGASSRPRYFQLRGIGELEQYQGAPNPSVGFLVDEIDFSGIGMIASLFDVEQVEVLRGPQGTRYGANALGGLIKVKTRDPSGARDLHAEAGAGEDGLWMAGVATGGAMPGGDGVDGAWRAVLHRAVSDGFRHNSYLGRDDTNGRDELTARLKLRLGAEKIWRADLNLMYADFDNGYDAFAVDNSFTTLSDRPGRDSQESRGASLDLSYMGSRDLVLRSITAWADSDVEASFDADWGNEPGWGAAGPYDFFSRTRRNRRTLSQDLRLMSDGAGGWSWLVGAWISRLEETNHIADDGRYLADAFIRLLDSCYR
ncbi:MAG: TonB-dependent receptor, partial [Steroidobacteraceae bacterium]